MGVRFNDFLMITKPDIIAYATILLLLILFFTLLYLMNKRIKKLEKTVNVKVAKFIKLAEIDMQNIINREVVELNKKFEKNNRLLKQLLKKS